MFSYSVRKQIASMIGALGGFDMIVFAGGIGEHDAAVRAEICDELPWIGGSASGCPVRVVPSQEDEQIARHSFALSAAGPG